MTIHLRDIIPPYTEMSDEDKLTLIKHIRHVKYVEKPAVKAKKAKVSTAKRKKAVKKTENLLAAMSNEQKLALLKALEEA